MAIVAILLIGINLLNSKYMLSVTAYQIKTNNKNALRIVHLTDVHDSKFGNNNDRLVKRVEEQVPDLIFVTGDLINSHQEIDISGVYNLICQLSGIAPVYISLGNQEISVMEKNGIDIVSLYEKAGAKVLDFLYEDIEIKGDSYRIGGIYGYCQPMAYAKEVYRDNESEFLQTFQDTDACKLLLCHMPVSWVDSYSLYDWDVNIVFSGHVHGGQIRIPFVGGLWAPDIGWLPGELEGVYTTTEEGWKESRRKLLEYIYYMNYDTSYYEEHQYYNPSYLVLSRGLGNTEWVPRFNNVPEIVVVDLVPDDITY